VRKHFRIILRLHELKKVFPLILIDRDIRALQTKCYALLSSNNSLNATKLGDEKPLVGLQGLVDRYQHYYASTNPWQANKKPPILKEDAGQNYSSLPSRLQHFFRSS
jgi:hypothetical protein